MKLAILEKKLPLRAYPEAELNRAVLIDFIPWLSKLLSLTGETSSERLEIALPALKDHCIGMGFAEIKKMFELYADNKLNIEPIPNYFDRVLLGRIVKSYRDNKPKGIKKEETMYISDEEKENIMKHAIDKGRYEWLNDGILDNPSSRYDYLDSNGKFKEVFGVDDTQWKALKKRRYEKAKEDIKNDYETKKAVSYADKISIKNALKIINKPRNPEVIRECKKQILIDYYEFTRG